MKVILTYLLILNGIFAMSQENCSNGVDDDGDGLIDCYDPDCGGNTACDGFFFGQNVDCAYPPNLPMTAKEDWTWGHPRVMSTQTPLAGDIDNDGVVEVLVAGVGIHPLFLEKSTNDSLFIVNGVDGTLELAIKTTRTIAGFRGAPFAMGDIDNDGFGEIIVYTNDDYSTDFGFECYEHDGTLKWVTNYVGLYDLNISDLSPQLADFNQDGIPEIYAQNYIFSSVNGSLLAYPSFMFLGSSGTGAQQTFYYAEGLYIAFSTAMDVLPDAFCPDCSGLELVAGDIVYSIDNSLTNLTPVTGTGSSAFDGFSSVADLDLDGDLEIVVTYGDPGFSPNFYVLIWDPLTNMILHQSGPYSGNFYSGGLTNIGNFDADPQLEIGFAGSSQYYVLDDITTGYTLKWSMSTSDNSGITSSILFDFQGDGAVEVVYQDEMQLYVLDGASGTVLYSYACGGGTLDNHPIVVDVDNDDQAEIVCACSQYLNNTGNPNNLDGYVVALGPNINPWVSARKVWNQGAYFIVNVEEDLSIPTVQQAHQLVPGGATNGYLIQQTLLDVNGQPVFIASDATAEITNIGFTLGCSQPGNLVDITVLFSNLGDAVLPASTPVAIYNGDPSTNGATLIGQGVLGTTLLENQSVSWNIQVPDQGVTFDLYVVIDDAAIAIPIQLPNAGIAECDYTNNTSGLSVSNCVVLAVSLTDWDVVPVGSEAHCVWKTVRETNNDYFLIERSADGVEFTAIGTVAGSGTTSESKTYSFIDAQPLDGLSYYRLLQVDYDGATTVFDAKSFMLISAQPWHLDYASMQLVFDSESVEARLYHTDGRLVAENSGRLMDVSGLATGTYFLVAADHNKQAIKTLVYLSPR